MEQKSKTYIRPIVIVMIFAFLTIGYAYLTSALNINGSTLLKKPTWDVHFENVQVKDGSVTGEQVTQEPEIDTEQTTVTFHVNLKKPGDFYEFTVDAVNAGTIDAMINNYSDLELTAAQQKYLETSITYEDGEEILEHQQLLAGDTATYKIRVGYKWDLDAEDLPSNPEQLDFVFSVEFVQRDNTAIERRAEAYSLYNVLKRENDSGSGYALLYTGSHQDSMNTSLSSRNIYFWRGYGETPANVVKEKYNVIFAGFCWNMIRTTDTGGVKLLYNGRPSNGKCTATGTSTHIGKSAFNANSGSPAYVGYMYNKSYDLKSRSTSSSGTHSFFSAKYVSSSTAYYFGDSVSYANGVYTLSNPESHTWSSDYSSLIGKYTCLSNDDYSCSDVYYVGDGTSGYLYGLMMSNGNLLADYNTSIVFGSSYTESNGVFTLTNTSSVSLLDWKNNYSSYTKKYTCNSNSVSCNDLAYVKTTSTRSYTYLFVHKYSQSYTYANGVYQLNSTNSYYISDPSSEYNNINKAHYSCFNASGVCEKLNFVYYYSSTGSTMNYVELENGITINQMLDDMLSADDVNTYDSTIKTYVDNWYANNMTNYTDYLEDVIFCNERSINGLGGWSPTGSVVNGSLAFRYNYISDYSLYIFGCTNETDKFSMSNNKAKLTYPVGLITISEKSQIGTYVFKTSEAFWTMSPALFSSTSSYEDIFGLNVRLDNTNSYGVRPVVSLKPGTLYASGDGSKNNPYVVETE